jgi:hypothetical protein
MPGNRRDCRACQHVGKVAPDQYVICTRDKEKIPWWVATDESPCGWFKQKELWKTREPPDR